MYVLINHMNNLCNSLFKLDLFLYKKFISKKDKSHMKRIKYKNKLIFVQWYLILKFVWAKIGEANDTLFWRL